MNNSSLVGWIIETGSYIVIYLLVYLTDKDGYVGKRNARIVMYTGHLGEASLLSWLGLPVEGKTTDCVEKPYVFMCCT